MNYLTCQEGNSDKFYEISTKGCEVSMRYGRTGTAGVSSLKSFGSAAEAQKFVTKTVAEKIKKGYCTSGTTAKSDDPAASKKRIFPEESVDEPGPAKKSKLTMPKKVAQNVIEPEKDDEDVAASSATSYTKYLTCIEGNSDKFYEISSNNTTVNIRYGKTGTSGLSQEKSFKSSAEALKFVEKTVAEKMKKGYTLKVVCQCKEGCIFTHEHNNNGSYAPSKRVEMLDFLSKLIKEKKDRGVTIITPNLIDVAATKPVPTTGGTSTSSSVHHQQAPVAAIQDAHVTPVEPRIASPMVYLPIPDNMRYFTKFTSSEPNLCYEVSTFNNSLMCIINQGNQQTKNNTVVYELASVAERDAFVEQHVADILTQGYEEEEVPLSGRLFCHRVRQFGYNGKAMDADTAQACMKPAQTQTQASNKGRSTIAAGASKSKIPSQSTVAVAVKPAASCDTVKTTTPVTAPVVPTPGSASASSSTAVVHMLECHEGGSNKFYELIDDGDCHITMRYGKVNSAGVTAVKDFTSRGEAAKFVTKTLNEKMNKGYKRC